ncbi:MAG: hypothetical protein KBS60_00345, partial [Phascolarctobacterium sp.]|nr:hypothetical protein [Candidatus Phascolarctobacterium caballi]
TGLGGGTNAGTVQMNGGSLGINLKGGKVVVNGSVTANASNINGATNTINSGKTLTFNGGALAPTVGGQGNVVIAPATNGTVTVNGYLENTGTVTVNANTCLYVMADHLKSGNITNKGRVKLNAGTVRQTISGGIIEINAGVHSTASRLAGSVTVNSGQTLYLNGDATLGGAISGAGHVIIETGNVTSAKNISNTGNFTINSGKTFSMTGGTVYNGSAISNSGTMTQTGGSVGKGMTNNGTLNVNGGQYGGAITNNSGKTFNVGGGTVNGATTNSGGIISITKGSVVGTITNNSTGKVTISGGSTTQVSGAITNGDGTNAATLTISGGTTSGAITNKNKSTVTINSGTALIQTGKLTNNSGATVTFSAGSIKSEISNAGTFTQSGGSITGNITNSGTFTNSAGNNSGTINNSGTFTKSGGISSGSVTNSKTINVSGGTISGKITNNSGGTVKITAGRIANIDLNSSALTMSAGSISGTITNNSGTVTQTGGTASGTITNGNGSNAATYNMNGGLITGAITNKTNGKLNVTAGTIKTGALTNNAAIDVTGGEISSIITNNSGGTIKVTGGRISGDVSNSGLITTGANLFTSTITNANNSQVILTGNSVNLTGTIAGSVTVNIGTSGTAAQITNASNKQITAGSFAITNASSSLSTSLSNVNISNGIITNYGTLTFTNGLITDKFHNIIDDNVTRIGVLNINGGDLNVGSYSIKQKGLSIGSSGKLTSDISKIDISDGTILNRGTLTLSGTGTLKNVLQDTTGKLYVGGTISSGSAIFNATTINNAGQLIIDVDDMRNTVTTNGVLVLKSNNIDDDGTGTHIDTLQNSVGGAGYIVIDGNVTNAAGSVISVEGNKIGGESYGIKIGAADKSFTATNATNIQTSIDNSAGGKVTFNGGVFSRDVKGNSSSGTAQTFINGSVTFNNAINDRIEVKEGANLTISANNVISDIFGNSSGSGNSTVSLRSGELNYAIRNQDDSSPSGNVVILDGESVTLGLNGKIGTNNLTLNPNSVLTFVNDASASAEVDLAQNLVVNSATLDLRDVKNRTYKVNGNISGYDATLNFDMINVSEGDHQILKGRYVDGVSETGTDEGYLSYPERDVFNVTNGSVSGTFKLGSINMTGSIYMYQRGDEVYAVERDDHSWTTVSGGTIQDGTGANVGKRVMVNGITPDGKVISEEVPVGIIGEISENILKEGDLEIDRIVLFGNGDGVASTSNLSIQKTTTKYGSFAYTFEQWGTNSPELKITAQPAELTLIEVINGRSMSGVTQGTAAHQFTQDEINAAYLNATDPQKLNDFEVVSGTDDYKFKDNLSETDKDKYRKYDQTMQKQVRMATQAASFNTYSFDQDTT